MWLPPLVNLPLRPFVNFPLRDAPPIGSPSVVDLENMIKGMIKNDVKILDGINKMYYPDLEKMIEFMIKNDVKILRPTWIIASAGGRQTIDKKTKKEWLSEEYTDWKKKKSILEEDFLYVAFEILTPAADMKTRNRQKSEGAKLLQTLDFYGITYGFIELSPIELSPITYPTDIRAMQQIVVRSHNMMWEAQAGKRPNTKISNTPMLVEKHSTARYDFLCLQECTGNTLEKLTNKLTKTKPNYELLLGTPHKNATAKLCIIYDKYRFNVISEKSDAAFIMRDGRTDNGRPMMAVVFQDRLLNKQLVCVACVHAPHGVGSYSLTDNLNLLIQEALKGAHLNLNSLAHIIIAGDFNREDWKENHYKIEDRVLASAQDPSNREPTVNNLAYDNILFSHTLNKTSFTVGHKFGSDHRVISATFDA